MNKNGLFYYKWCISPYLAKRLTSSKVIPITAIKSRMYTKQNCKPAIHLKTNANSNRCLLKTLKKVFRT